MPDRKTDTVARQEKGSGRKCRKVEIEDVLPHMGWGLIVEEGISLFLSDSHNHITLDSRWKGWPGEYVGEIDAPTAEKLKEHAQAICDILNARVPENKRSEDWSSEQE